MGAVEHWFFAKVAGSFIVPAISIAIAATLCVGARVDAQQISTLSGNRPADLLRMHPHGAPDPAKLLALEVTLRLRNREDLDQLLKEQQDPKSSHYRRWLSPQEFVDRFGPAQTDLDLADNWLRAQGFQITAASLPGRYIRFNGTVAAVERAFATHLAGDGRGHYGNLTEPSVPEELGRIIGAIHGLDNIHRTVSMHRLMPGSEVLGASHMELPPLEVGGFLKGLAPPTAGGVVRSRPEIKVPDVGIAFGPGDLHTFYDETPLLSAGYVGAPPSADCIAIVGLTDFLEGAVSLFNSTFGLPSSTITTVYVDGTNPGTNGNEFEALADLEWSHAAAPGAPSRFYVGNPSTSTPIADAIRAAVNENLCAVVSISYTSCGEPANFFAETLDPLFAQGATQGQSIFVASGDDGAAGLVFDSTSDSCVTGTTRNVSEMAADPNVTAVGGSSFLPDYDSAGNVIGSVPENVWNAGKKGGGASGGGVSAIFPKPYWQSGPGVPSDGSRDLPDIAMVASAFEPGLFFSFDNGGTPLLACCIGGTSLGAPIWAGLTMVLAQKAETRIGHINPRLYQMAGQGEAANGLRDITHGINSFNGVQGFAAGPGFDLSTGWGTIDAARFVPAFLGAPSIGTLPPTVYAGASFEMEGTNFTPGSMVNFFVSTSHGPVNAGPLKPADQTAATLTVLIPASITLGQGVAGVQVVNTDQNYVSSGTALTLLEGAASAGIPTITMLNGTSIAPTSTEPGYGTANVQTVVPLGAPVTINGSGFDTANGIAVDIFCSCSGGKVGPFFMPPSSSSAIVMTIASTGPGSPGVGPGGFRVTNAGASHAYAYSSNSVSAPIGAVISITGVTQSGSTVTVNGSGFSELTVINFFNTQSGGVVNIGGLGPGGSPRIPLSIINSGTFTFTVPAGAIVGASYVQALNPPFVPFTSTGSNPAGAFDLEAS